MKPGEAGWLSRPHHESNTRGDLPGPARHRLGEWNSDLGLEAAGRRGAVTQEGNPQILTRQNKDRPTGKSDRAWPFCHPLTHSKDTHRASEQGSAR